MHRYAFTQSQQRQLPLGLFEREPTQNTVLWANRRSWPQADETFCAPIGVITFELKSHFRHGAPQIQEVILACIECKKSEIHGEFEKLKVAVWTLLFLQVFRHNRIFRMKTTASLYRCDSIVHHYSFAPPTKVELRFLRILYTWKQIASFLFNLCSFRTILMFEIRDYLLCVCCFFLLRFFLCKK